MCFAAAVALLGVALTGLPFVVAAPFALLTQAMIAYYGLRLAEAGSTTATTSRIA